MSQTGISLYSNATTDFIQEGKILLFSSTWSEGVVAKPMFSCIEWSLGPPRQFPVLVRHSHIIKRNNEHEDLIRRSKQTSFILKLKGPKLDP